MAKMVALGVLTERYKKWIASLKRRGPNDWVFPQDVDLTQPRWDSGVRKALKDAARSIKQNPNDPKDLGLDFPGFGPHSLRRANITRRQDVGGSAIEASKIAGHPKVDTTLEYTIIGMKPHDTLTRRIQPMREQAAKKTEVAAQTASAALAAQRERAKIARAARKKHRSRSRKRRWRKCTPGQRHSRRRARTAASRTVERSLEVKIHAIGWLAFFPNRSPRGRRFPCQSPTPDESEDSRPPS